MTTPNIDKEFAKNLLHLAEDLSYSHETFGPQRDSLFQSVVTCAFNSKVQSIMDDRDRIILSNHIMSYVVKDAISKGILSKDDNNKVLEYEQYKREQLAIYSLREGIIYSDKLYAAITRISEHVADTIIPDFPNVNQVFAFMPIDIKLIFADYISEFFINAARHEIWEGLEYPCVITNPISKKSYGTSYSFHDYSEALQSRDFTKIKIDNIIGIGANGYSQNAVEFGSTIIHECVHDIFNQIAAEVYKPVPMLEQPLKNFRYDFAIASVQRIFPADVSIFPLLYHTDFEEKLCRHAEEVFQKIYYDSCQAIK